MPFWRAIQTKEMAMMVRIDLVYKSAIMDCSFIWLGRIFLFRFKLQNILAPWDARQ
jgi:hypothetical protein